MHTQILNIPILNSYFYWLSVLHIKRKFWFLHVNSLVIGTLSWISNMR